MRPRIPIRRILFLRPFRPPNSPRSFAHNTLLSQSRPHFPFLASPNRRPIARFLTTERKKWIKSEVLLAGKYTVYYWTASFLLFVLTFGIHQEWCERKYPTPHEWTWITRKDLRSNRCDDDQEDDVNKIVNWSHVGHLYLKLLKRLEDPNIDGAGLKDTVEGGILVAGIGRTGYDISAKSEPWRRGYYEVIMGAARAAEHLDGHLTDKTRMISFPANVVIGPSNPDARPVPPGSPPPPREEDCESTFEPPDKYYMKILTTQGFTEKQRVGAALAYASWLEYKKTPQAALDMYRWALDIASSGNSTEAILDTSTGVLNTNAGSPSANLLSATTALAVHHAANGNVSEALPVLVSILRARRSLQDEPTTMQSTLIPDEDPGLTAKLTSFVRYTLVPPAYPPPPDDGTTAPLRGPKERCEEAAVMTYVGEILYASKFTGTSREEGLAWTREAVDIAEEELRRKTIEKPAKKTCKQCLEVGLSNWQTMVATMVKEEQGKEVVKKGSWLGKSSEQKDTLGRWESEEKVIKERIRRAKDILSAPSLASGSSSWSLPGMI